MQRGPFRGMQILPDSFWGDGDITPKLLGVYEQELHEVILQVIDDNFDAIVNIGAGEGYYSVGLALRCASVPIYAFESDIRQHPIIQKSADLNRVAGRVEVRGACNPLDIIALAHEHGRLFVLCDCEGFETTLFPTPGVAEALHKSNVLVECHDFIDPNSTPMVFTSLWRTHRIDLIYSGGRDPGAFPLLSQFSDIERWTAVCENRPKLMNWLVCRAK